MIALHGAALALAVAGGFHLEPQGTLWLELDTNAKRVPSGQLGDDAATPKPPVPTELPVSDGLVRAELSLATASDYEGLALRSDVALGGKWFFTQESERMAVGQLHASASSSKLPGDVVMTLAGLVKGRAQLSGARTYGFARSDAVLEKPMTDALDWLVLRGGVNGVGFLPYEPAGAPLPDVDDDSECEPAERASGDADCALGTSISSAGGGLMAGARALLGPSERVDVLLDAGLRGFPFFELDSSGERRVDSVLTGLVQLTSARKLYVSVGWLVLRNDSNARGESWTRHRLNAAVGFRLPADITCTAQAALQLTLYDDGVSVGQAFFLGDDEDSQNILEITLSRQLVDGLWLQARGSVLGNELAVEGARFSRQTASIGIRGELPE